VATNDKDRALTIRLPAELHDQLRDRAAAEERTIAGVLRLAARRYLTDATKPAVTAPSGSNASTGHH
jgi:hypothetical protein